MRVIEKNIYKFEELEKDIQEELIKKEKEWARDNYVEFDLYDDLIIEAKILLKKFFGEKASFCKIFYDLNYSQGSGAMMEFELSYYNTTQKIKQYGYYYHERSFEIVGDDLTEKREKKLKEKIITMNEQLTKIGYSFIENEESNAEAIEELKKHEYYINGNIY